MDYFGNSTDSGTRFVFNSEFRLAITFLILILATLWLWKRKKYNLPPGPIGLPFVGYFPFLGNEPYITFDNLKKEYGSVFSLYIGRTLVVVLGDYEAVKDGLGKSTTTDRPHEAFRVIPEGVGLSSLNGEEWTEQRKYTVKAMRDFGLGRGSWESVVMIEVDDFLKLIDKENGKPFDVCRLLTASVVNNIWTFLFGQRMQLTEENIDFLYEFLHVVFENLSQAGVQMFFPKIYDFLVKVRTTKLIKAEKQMTEFNKFVHEECKKVEDNTGSFVSEYRKVMSKRDANKHHYSFNERNLHGNVQAVILGTTETTRTSLTWIFLLMAEHQDIQAKVHSEVNAVLGREGRISWADRASIPYTYSVIMEGQRYVTIAPLNTARLSMEDIKIGGYDVPKGTTIIGNNWGVHNDTKYWKNPRRFDPDRFLMESKSTKTEEDNGGKQVNFKPESYIPFSYGKRMCPGESIAMMEILFYFVSVIQKFHIRPPEGSSPNLQGVLGLTYMSLPQKLRFLPRER